MTGELDAPINDQEEKEILQHYSGLDFAFDPENGIFLLSGKTKQKVINPFDDTNAAEIQLRELYATVYENDNDFVPPLKGLVFTPIHGIVISKSMQNDLQQMKLERYREMEKKVASAMKEVFRATYPNPESIKGIDDFDFFNLGIRSSGDFNLNTMGECACLGPIPNLLNDSFTTYETHNDDYYHQTLSLYAGAGALAWMTEKRESGQQNLGLIE